MAKKDDTPVGLRPFVFHDVVNMERSDLNGDEYIDDCPFCGKENHLYVNAKTGLFDCKVCDASGNQFGFLEQFWEMWHDETTSDQYRELSRNRGIPVPALRAGDVAYDSNLNRWLIPVRNPSTGTMQDLRVWTEHDNMNRSTKGMKSGLWNGHQLFVNRKRDWPVWICEGEWDGIAMQHIAKRNKLKIVVVAVPGANTFKSEWSAWFNGRDVVAAYDNDNAGRDGFTKVVSGRYDDDGELIRSGILAANTRRRSYVRWLSGVPDGYDIRDIMHDTDDAETAWCTIEPLVTSVTPPKRHRVTSDRTNTTDVSDDDDGTPHAERDNAEPPSFDDVVAVFRRWVHMTDDFRDALKVALAVAIAREFDEDPLWLYMIGASGSGKTLITDAFRSADGVEFQSTLTRTTLISGFKSTHDPSLLARLDGKCLVLKDFTEVLELPGMEQDQVFSTLRGAFDGEVSRIFGNDVVRNYTARFSFLAACTPQINTLSKASMGERFLKFQLATPIGEQTDEVVWAALSNVGKRQRMENEMEEIVARFLYRVVSPDVFDAVPDRYKKRIHALCQLIECLRSTVTRDRYTQEVLVRPVFGVGTRIGKQLVILACALAEVSGTGTLTDDDYNIVERVAFDTATGWNLDIVQVLMKYDEPVDAKTLALDARLPETNTRNRLRDLCELRIIEKIKDENAGVRNSRFHYTVAENIRRLWMAADVGSTEHATRSIRVRRRRRKQT